jgi:hypothetical protein
MLVPISTHELRSFDLIVKVTTKDGYVIMTSKLPCLTLNYLNSDFYVSWRCLCRSYVVRALFNRDDKIYVVKEER